VNLAGIDAEQAVDAAEQGGLAATRRADNRDDLALAVEPSVLLMDEPFAAVDAQTREILQFELLRIWEERPTAMIFVTHSIEEAVLLGHRVIVLKGRPSGIHEIIEIDLPNPRTRDTLREPRFAELRERVWNTLMREAREAEFHLER
jgi:NitT/TauT family transport system ATP-binding protein